MNDAAFAPATDLADAIRTGDASAAGAVDTYLERIAAHEALNAVVTVDADVARERAEAADAAVADDEVWGPLHGVPITLKDVYETAGLRTTSSFEPLSDYVPDRDATVVARLRDAGAIVLGKTNQPMLATDYQSDSPVFGRADNPWDGERTPGGSSGGSGAAVAAGLTGLGLGSDLGGSVRVPSHFCGVYGLKPTEHRVPATGTIPDWHVPGVAEHRIVRHMGTFGPLARSVSDLELALSVIEGPDGHDTAVPPVPDEAVPSDPLADGRVAWCDTFGDLSTSVETASAVADVAERLEATGCDVEGVTLDFDFEAAWRTWGHIVAAELSTGFSLKLRGLFWLLFMTSGRPPIDRGITSGIWSRRRAYHAALSRRQELSAAMNDLLGDYDALLCPVAATPAFTHRRTGASIEVDGSDVPYMMAAAGFATVFNLTGHPVVAMPTGHRTEGLPIGMQVVGHRWRDRSLLATAAAIDEVIEGYEPPPMD